MMMRKRIKQGSAFVLAAALVFSAFVLPEVNAARQVDTEKKCQLEVAVGSSYSELTKYEVDVHLYKVADITKLGEYEAVEAVEDVLELDFSLAEDRPSAAKWEEMALAVKEAIDEGASIEPIKNTVAAESSSVKFTDLAAGLYLVDAQECLSPFYKYTFTPYLVSLPDNNYYYSNEDGTEGTGGSGGDEWVYSYQVNLKPLREDRYGDLVIEKELDVYNETLDGADFVFEVYMIKRDIDDTDVVLFEYSNVYLLDFDAPGTKSILIEDIPAGSVVTVTEVNTGASYTVTSAGEITVQQGLPATDEVDEGKAPYSVSFGNTSTDALQGGKALVNRFTYEDGVWDGYQVESDSESTENIIVKIIEEATGGEQPGGGEQGPQQPGDGEQEPQQPEPQE